MKHSKSALFLMELIIAILFFSLASTVCIQLFSKAHLLSKQTVAENHAVIQAQNLAECYLATEGDMLQMKELFPAALDTPDDRITLAFDENWKECKVSDSCYTACLMSYPAQDGLISADIVIKVSDDNTGADTLPIYSLTITHHIPERRGNLDY